MACGECCYVTVYILEGVVCKIFSCALYRLTSVRYPNIHDGVEISLYAELYEYVFLAKSFIITT